MILIYINATSMTCNGIMTLCKHRLPLVQFVFSCQTQRNCISLGYNCITILTASHVYIY